MKQEHSLPNFFFLEILLYGIGSVLFVGLLLTVGSNTFLSHVFLSTGTDTAYIQSFSHMNRILFWSATVLLFLFVASCSTLFRCVPLLSISKKRLSKMQYATKFLRAFFRQWSLIILVVVLSWLGSMIGNVTSITKQDPIYENRAEFYPKVRPMEFAPQAALKES